MAGAYSGGHLPRLLMKAARPSTRRPPRPRPPRPRPAPGAPGGYLRVARAPPAGSAVLDPAHRAATGRVARHASLFPGASSWPQGAAGLPLGLTSL